MGFCGAFSFGLFLGLVREWSGGLTAASLIHVGGNVYPVYFQRDTAGSIGCSVAFSISIGVLLALIIGRRIRRDGAGMLSR